MAVRGRTEKNRDDATRTVPPGISSNKGQNEGGSSGTVPIQGDTAEESRRAILTASPSAPWRA